MGTESSRSKVVYAVLPIQVEREIAGKGVLLAADMAGVLLCVLSAGASDSMHQPVVLFARVVRLKVPSTKCAQHPAVCHGDHAALQRVEHGGGGGGHYG